MKKIFFILLVILLPIVAKADDSGTCGNNLTWTFVEATGTLTISGTGAMNNYNYMDYYNPAPWYSYRSKILKTEIGDGVTSIGDYAFWYCSSLTSTNIPESVTSIGVCAFYGCSSMKEVHITDIAAWCNIKFNDNPLSYAHHLYLNGEEVINLVIPDGVTSIGDYAFSGCSSLTSITIPESVTSIGRDAFEDCSNLTSITIPESVTSIDHAAFHDCSSLKEVHITDIAAWCNIIFAHYYSNPLNSANHLYLNGKEVINLVIPNGVTSIADYAFSGCSSLTSVTIPESVTSIGNDAFRECSSLTSINIPDGVTSIGKWTFQDCSSLTSITIPDGVTSIGDCAFHSCSSLASINIPESVTSIGSHAFYECSNLTSITIPESVTSIDEYTFYKCSSLTSINIPEGVASIGKSAFYECSRLKKVHITDIAAWCNIKFNDSSSNPLSYAHHLYLNGDEIRDLVMPDTLKSISNLHFRDCYSFTSITIPDYITIIEEGTFSGCKNVKNLKLPDSLFRINKQAFYGCKQLETITIPESVEVIYQEAFKGCGLKSVKVLAKNPPFAYDNTFSNYDGELWVPEESISSYQSTSPWSNFETFKNLTGLEIVEHITFADAKVKGICVANWDTNGDGELSMSEAAAVTDLGKIFRYNTEITSFDELQYFTGVTSIGGSAFFGCSSLTSITIPDGVTSIGEEAFDNCSSLTSITIPNGVTSIGDYAFWYCSSLTSITIPESVTSIGESAFSCCSSLNSITVDENNKTYDSRNNCNAIIETASNKLVTGCSNTIIPESVTSIGYCAFRNCSSLTSITIPESVTSIGIGAFYECSSLTSITIPDGVTSIGNFAFYFCRSLTSINIPESVTSIGNGAFRGCSSLTSITIPESVTSIGDDAFSDCSSLTSITIPESVTSIGEYAFYSCSSLTSITIPESVTSIGDAAFYKCSSLTSVTMGASTPVDITSNVFPNRTNATLYVPYGSKEAYKAASYWNEFKEIVEYGRPTEITITINQYGSGTYCSDLPLDFTNVEGLNAYVAGGFNTSTKTVMMYRVNTTKGNTGLFIKGTPGEYVVPVLKSSDDNYMNMLVGTTKQVTVNSKSDDGNYVNFKYTIKSGDQKPRFYEFTDGSTLSANKAYLQVPASWLPVTSEARTMNIMFDDEDVTGIEENYEFNMNSDGSVYDLSGRRVNHPTKGMYIVNGKKVVIK